MSGPSSGYGSECPRCGFIECYDHDEGGVYCESCGPVEEADDEAEDA